MFDSNLPFRKYHSVENTRTSNKHDISLQNQYDKLKQSYGVPDTYFKDNSSGLNENRKGLKQLFTYIK